MGKLSWGKPTILIQDAEETGAPWLQTPNPVKDSTNLEPEEGETQTAECEGGEVEDEMHAKNKATLSFEIRAAKDRHLIVDDNDGVIDHHHRIAIIPQNPLAPGVLIDKGSMHATPGYTCAEGIKRTYKVTALEPEDGSHKVKIGKINVTRENGVITSVTCEEETAAPKTVSASPTSLSFGASSAASQTIAISGATAITSATANRGWLTVTYSGTTITVAAADNPNTSARQASVYIVANGETVKIPVSQAGAA